MISFLNQPEWQLDAYIDDLLESEERMLFERRLAQSPSLQAEVRLQRRIDKTLVRVLSLPETMDKLLPPAIAEIINPTPTHRSTAKPSSTRISPVRRLAIAAAIAGFILSAWLIVQSLQGPSPQYQPPPWKNMLAIYQDDVVDGFKPDWVCRDDEEFANTFRGHYGQRLQLRPLPGNVAALGFSYAHTISQRTLLVLVYVDERPVMVFVDRIANDDRQSWPAESILHLHRSTIGELVLYELSPFDEPQMLSYFFDPDDPKRDSASGAPDGS